MKRRKQHIESTTKRIAIVCAVAAIFTATPYSIQISKRAGIAVAANQAEAVIGRPATAGSVAGVARCTTRRHIHAHGAYYHHPYGRAWVNGVRVCR